MRSVAGLSVYLTAADLRERYKCSRMLVYRQIKQHHFPKPVKFGNGSGVHRRWLAANVQAYEEERLTKPNRTRTAASRTAHSPQPSHAEEPCPPGPAPVIVRFDLRRIGAGATQRIRGA